MKTKYHHAGALVLVLWYLMMAPPPGPHRKTQSIQADTAAPLSRWTIVGIFPTQKECAAHRGANSQERCVAADDPRFRENNPPP